MHINPLITHQKQLQHLHGQSLAEKALIKRGGRKFTSQVNSPHQKILLAKAYERAIQDLQVEKKKTESQLKKFTKSSSSFSKISSLFFKKTELQKANFSLNVAIHHLEQMQKKVVPQGVQKGLEVVQLQKALEGKVNAEKRELISNQIANIFASCETYEELSDLRETIDDASSVGSSGLHKLVFDDLDVESCHRVLNIINEKVQEAYEENPNQIHFYYMVYSDIDDTIKGSLNDRQSHIKGFYPGAMEFYKQLTTPKSDNADQIHLTFLSARPKLKEKVQNKHMQKKLPRDTQFFALYGSVPASIKAAKYYVYDKWTISSLANRFKGEKKTKVKEALSNPANESKVYTSFAFDKRKNIDRDLLLRPEARPIMIGDCGEGDLILLLTKNSGVRSPLDDERIPEKYRGNEKWKGSLDAPGNPSNKPLHLGLAHELSTPTDYQEKPDPKHKEIYANSLNTHIFNNYVDNALVCLQKGFFDKKAADAVVNAARKWLKDNNVKPMEEALQNEKVLESLPAADKYRQRLILSIRKYDASTV